MLALIFLGLPWAALAVPSIPAGKTAPPREMLQLAQRMESLAELAVSKAKVSGLALALTYRDQVVSARGFGVTQTGGREAVDAGTVFRLASVSKTFAGALAAQLVRDGTLTWDTRISTPLPGFRLRSASASQQLTVLDVLSHRIGIPFHTFDRDLESNQPYPLLAERLAQAPMSCQPGDCYAYQNIGFSLIGDVVFASTGSFYSFEVERRLFHPLGMRSATYGREALEASPRWARPHVRARGRWVAVRPKETYYRVPPAAGVNASIRDLTRWLIAQTGGAPDVLGPELLAELHRPRVRTPSEIRGGWRSVRLRDAHYGIGWRVFDYAGHKLVFHAGAVQGYRAVVAFLPAQRFGMALLWNCESAVPAGLLPTAIDAVIGLQMRDWTGLEAIRLRQRKR